MKIISIEGGRAAQSFVPDEISPPAGLYLPELIRLVSDRYGFASQPSVESATKQGAKFGQGRLIAGSKKINITELGIYNDAAHADTKNTTDSDFVLEDIINWARQTFTFREPLTVISRKYESAIVVEFEKKIGGALRAFENIGRSVAGALREAYGVNANIDIARIAFASDITPSYELHRSDFLLERRIGRPYSENRFYSVAPVRTEVHLNLLETFERELGAD